MAFSSNKLFKLKQKMNTFAHLDTRNQIPWHILILQLDGSRPRSTQLVSKAGFIVINHKLLTHSVKSIQTNDNRWRFRTTDEVEATPPVITFMN